ncbi:MAG: Peptide chain release factor 2 [Candidatus Jorgensenbacteria bacterium GW2011_GWA1_48_11]|uniref:Peptide chain release factor 2 n=1 Tax=Candidatus Jorgensenbacteria bacterium GW2011_GWA1_48_11 TaxID=1618660 RepID=A0A0G1UBB3_9BACT|nr:MAG: Peptide chain release factor 2 [Candidatus Jorgensenbacteria bacterium GW2011_GWA1_48_11]KKW11949.1 MAG: Peptide chain release factor 2 [Candidatus Jorgensenbacteria bacterium GW2011_GWB1_49_9]
MNYNSNTVTISVLGGAGGDDAKDWAQMLLRMYSRYADLKKWKKAVVSENTLEISGMGVYERLKDESGVHRLVRISPFDAKKLRHTSFALVEVLPDLPKVDEVKIQIPEKDLKIEFSRSAGPGGQNVNKVETAVRIVHLPTGLSSSSQVERSQSSNREKAMHLLKIKIAKLMEDRHEEAVGNLRVRVAPEWGHEIRSYVLHPYKQVKDHATGFKISRVEEVLEGNLDLLLKAGVK